MLLSFQLLGVSLKRRSWRRSRSAMCRMQRQQHPYGRKEMSRSSSGIPRAKMFLRLTKPTSWIKLVLSSHTGVGRKGLGPRIDLIWYPTTIEGATPHEFSQTLGTSPHGQVGRNCMGRTHRQRRLRLAMVWGYCPPASWSLSPKKKCRRYMSLCKNSATIREAVAFQATQIEIMEVKPVKRFPKQSTPVARSP